MRCEELFFDTYGKFPDDITFCPYRISPLGAHIDHQNGIINGLAINKGIFIAYSKTHNRSFEIQSVNFKKLITFTMDTVPKQKAGDWADHMRGSVIKLMENYKLAFGINAVIEGSLPIGGLSSSAAVIIAFMSAVLHVNNIAPDPWKLIMMAKEVENEYVGVNCGKLDQSCEVLCKRDHMLYLDCRDDSYSLIPKHPDMNFGIAVFFSGLERSLASSAYNLRQDECKAAAYSLMAFSGMKYGKFKETYLRDVPYSVYQEYGHLLPENFRKRAEHFFAEFRRAQQGAEIWKAGNIQEYGKLIFESGKSSIDNYECGCPELITLYNIMTETDGIYGGRFSGAGFKGCCMALIDPDKSEEILHHVEEKYLKVYPNLSGKYLGVTCESANGVML